MHIFTVCWHAAYPGGGHSREVLQPTMSQQLCILLSAALYTVHCASNQALQLLPSTLAEIDAAGAAIAASAVSGPSSSSARPSAAAAVARLDLALRGVFAGNIFDLGAAASAALYAEVVQGRSMSQGKFKRGEAWQGKGRRCGAKGAEEARQQGR